MFTIDNQTFSTKAALERAIKAIVPRYQDGESLSEGDQRFVVDVLARHPQADEKIGCGVARLFVSTHPKYPTTRCFWIERTDGTLLDFSWKQCLTPRTRRQDFDKACRGAIRNQTVAFRETYFLQHDSPTCAVTGEPLTADACHVDHVIPFKELVDRFIAEYGIDVEAAPINDGEDKFERPFTCEAFGEKWAAYHQQHATLRVVTPQANLSLLRRGGTEALAL